VDTDAAANQEKVNSSSRVFLTTVGGLLLLLYGALLLLVRNGQRIINEQRRAQEQSAMREQRWHREKMVALATMTARVAHELGNPLATISGLAEDIANREEMSGKDNNKPRQILDQTRRIAGMIRQIADFAAARSEKPELIDLNQMVEAVCNFLRFDSRFASTQIVFHPEQQLSACVVIPDRMNEVLMNLLQACVEVESIPTLIAVETRSAGMDTQILIACEPESSYAGDIGVNACTGARVESVRRHLTAMGGKLEPIKAGARITLCAIRSG
jgi:signal transduction histidine kinase